MSDSSPAPPGFPSWPKPSRIPWWTMALAAVNTGLLLFLALWFGNALTHVALLVDLGWDAISWWRADWLQAAVWLSPLLTLNGFFWWAEWRDFSRERRSFEGWMAEMASYNEVPDEATWTSRIEGMRQARRNARMRKAARMDRKKRQAR